MSNDKVQQQIYSLYKKIILEKYFSYSVPQDKEKLLFDFYVVSYLNYLITSFPSKQFRDLPIDLEDSVKDAKNKLYPFLKQELLHVVFFAICCEFVHISDFEEAPYSTSTKYPMFLDMYNTLKANPNLVTGRSDSNVYNASYKFVSEYLTKTHTSIATFVSQCEKQFYDAMDESEYGGWMWYKVCEGWLMLNDAKSEKDLVVAIDHIYDLEHNSGTIFNKVPSYRKNGSYDWIKSALKYKANTQSFFTLLKYCSGSVRDMATPVIKNRIG